MHAPGSCLVLQHSIAPSRCCARGPFLCRDHAALGAERVTFYIAKIEKAARKRVGEYRYFESLHRKGLLRARDLNAYRRKVKIRIDYRINAGGSLLERPTVIEWR
jgi:hypothetical protein